jgi:hypothetical protein
MYDFPDLLRVAVSGIVVSVLMALAVRILWRRYLGQVAEPAMKYITRTVREITEPLMSRRRGDGLDIDTDDTQRPPKERAILAHLTIEDGADLPPITVLQGDVLQLGRDPALATATIDDPTVSRLHASIRQDDKGILHIHDEGSTNETLVNGQAVSAEGQPLHDGDVVALGRVRLRFDAGASRLDCPPA